MVLELVIGTVISGSVWLKDDPDSDSVESLSCLNLASIKIFVISTTPLFCVIICHKD